MAVITWDQFGEKTFQAGIDRGVLYPFDGDAVAWNGLTSITEDTVRDVKSYYLDGLKYMDHFVVGSYSAKLQAITYPDAMDEICGDAEFAPGVFTHDQQPKMFHLCYRTLIGNDIMGVDYGYKLHLVWNLTATRTTPEMGSLGGNVGAAEFQFDLTGVPATMFGIRPTSHISIDSRRIDPDLLLEIENQLYGTPDTDPALMDTVDFLALVET